MTDPTPVEGNYDPQLLTVRDRMRSRVGDVGPDFMIPDVTYEAQISYESDWRLATAAIADQLAGMYDQDPDSFTATGIFSVGFVDRGAALRKLAQQLRAEVRAEQPAAGYGVRSVRPEREDERAGGEYSIRRRGGT